VENAQLDRINDGQWRYIGLYIHRRQQSAGGRACATSIHFSTTRARCDIDNDVDDSAADEDDDSDGDADADDGVLLTTDAMTRCVTALN